MSITHIHGLLGEDSIIGIDNESQLNISYPISKKGDLSNHFSINVLIKNVLYMP